MVVTDPKGTSGMDLALCNYSSTEESVGEVDLDDILPPGSFLVLKNPWFMLTPGGFMLRCDNPAEVELVSRKRVEAKFPGNFHGFGDIYHKFHDLEQYFLAKLPLKKLHVYRLLKFLF